MEEIKLPDSITTMGYQVFENDTALKTVNYPKNYSTSVDYNGASRHNFGEIFYGCTALETVTIPEGTNAIAPYAFRNSSISHITIPESITIIDEYTFAGCKSLETVSLHDNIQTLGAYSFSDCSGLEKIVLPDSIKTIGKYAFSNCTNLASINYPALLTSAGTNIFYGDTLLEIIAVPEPVTVLPDEIFNSADKLKRVILPDSLITVGKNAFKGAACIKKIILPDSVKTINASAFANMTGLTDIWIGESVSSIASGVFSGCDMQKLTIHGVAGSYAQTYAENNSIAFSEDGFDYDGTRLFGSIKDISGKGIENINVIIYDANNQKIVASSTSDSQGLWSYNLGNIGTTYIIYASDLRYDFDPSETVIKVTESGEYEVKTMIATLISEETTDVENFSYSFLSGGGISITGYTGEASDLIVPERIESRKVTTIADSAFAGNETVVNVRIPDTVTKIGNKAFQNCASLSTVKFSGKLVSIGEYAFDGCSSLAAIRLPQTVTTIGQYAFSSCTELSSFNYPYSLSSVGSGVFKGDSKLTSFTVGEGTKKLPENMFAEASALKNVDLPESLTSIGKNAFLNCSGLSTIRLPDTVSSIGDYAFKGCTELVEINYPVSLSSAGTGIFSGDTKLKTIIVPEGVTQLPDNVFREASYIQRIQLPSALEKIGAYSFYNCTSLTDLNVPDTVTSFGSYAFGKCSSLRDFVYPKSLVTSATGALQGTSFKEIHVPEGVEKLADYIFSEASENYFFYLPSTLTTVGQYSFSNATQVERIELPDSVLLIDNYAFRNCTGLTDIWIGENVTSISSNAFSGCSTSKLTIHGIAGSYAQTFAEENGFAFSTERFNAGPSVIKGRVVGNDAIETSGAELHIGDASQIEAVSDSKGISGVTLQILDAETETVIATPTTDENGNWLYEHARPGAKYIVSAIKSGIFAQPLTMDVTASEKAETEVDSIKGVKMTAVDDYTVMTFGWASVGNASGSELIAKLNNTVFNEDGIATVDGIRYRKMSNGTYKIMQPIRWRVLSANSDNTVTLISETAMAVHEFGGMNASDWEVSSLRSYLKDEFYRYSFLAEERNDIVERTISSIKVGKGFKASHVITNDKVYVFSGDDYMNPNYGFSSSSDADLGRAATHDTYEIGSVTTPAYGDVSSDKSRWFSWTRDVPNVNYGLYRPLYVTCDGELYIGYNVYSSWYLAVRPVINVRVDSEFLHEYVDPDAPIKLKEVSEMTEEYVGFFKNKYKLFDDALTWEEAEEYCESIGGHLAIITSPEEQSAINYLLGQGGKDYYWLGAKANSTESNYVWLDGDYTNYYNWKSGTALDSHYKKNGKIIALGKNTKNWGEWDTADDTFYNYNKEKFGFICQMGEIGKITETVDVNVQDFYGDYSDVLYNNESFRHYNMTMLGYLNEAYDHMTSEDPDIPDFIDIKYWKHNLLPAIKWSSGNLLTLEHARYTLKNYTGYDFNKFSDVLSDYGIYDSYETTEEKILDEMTLTLVKSITKNASNTANGKTNINLVHDLVHNVAERNYVDDARKPIIDLCTEYYSDKDINKQFEFFRSLPLFDSIEDEDLKEVVESVMRLEDNETYGDYFQIIKANNTIVNVAVPFVDIILTGATIMDLQYEMIACMKSYYPEYSVIYHGLDRLENKLSSQDFVKIMINMLDSSDFTQIIKTLASTPQVKNIVQGLGASFSSLADLNLTVTIGKLFYGTISKMIPTPSFEDYIKANNARAMALETWFQLEDERAKIVLAHRDGTNLDSTEQINKDRLLHAIHVIAIENAADIMVDFLSKEKEVFHNDASTYIGKIKSLQDCFDGKLDYNSFIKQCAEELNTRYSYYYGEDPSLTNADEGLNRDIDASLASINAMAVNNEALLSDSSKEEKESVHIRGLASYSDPSEMPGLLVIPSVVDGKPVSALDYRSFYKNKEITAVFIPSSVKSIGEQCFEGCENLRIIMIEDGVEMIGDRAFASCENLNYINIPSTVNTVGEKIFDECSADLTIDVIGGSVSEEKLKEYSDSFNIQDKIPVSISINTPAAQTQMRISDALDTSGLSLLVSYADGDSDIIYDEMGVSLTDRKPGSNTVTVYYRGLSVQYEVEIVDSLCDFAVAYLDEHGEAIAPKYHGTAEYGSVISLPHPDIEGYSVDESTLNAEIENDKTYYVVYKFNRIDLASASIKADERYYFEGKPVYPEIEVKYSEEVLKEYEDYVSWYENNDTIGTAQIHVRGIGSYTGEATASFELVYPGGLWITNVEDLVFTGKALTQKDLEVYDNDRLLALGKDYTLKYSNNTKAGTASITVTGKGNYKSKDIVEFNILPKDISDNDVKVNPLNAVKYNKKAQKLKPVIKYNGKTLKLSKDYTLDYSDDVINPGTVTVTVSGVGNYSGTRTLTYDIVPDSQIMASKLTVSKISNQTYTGQPILPELTVKYKGDTLKEDFDYVLDYKDNMDVGTATVFINGLGRFSGIKTVTFKITGLLLSKAKVSNIASSFVYDGTEKIQSPVLTYQKDKNSEPVTLIEDTDYILTYLKNDKAGTATLQIRGIGLYTGSIKKTYKITPYDLSTDVNGKISVLYSQEASYNKAGARPDIVVYYEDTLLTEGTDYTLSYANNKSVAANPLKLPSFTVKGKGNFKGSLKKEFTITPRNISDDIIMTSADKVYSLKKNGWKAAPVLTDNGKKLKAGTDYDKNILYTYAYIPEGENIYDGSKKERPVITRNIDDIVEANDILPSGTQVKITVKGIKNYEGEASYTYRITDFDISKAKVSVVNKEYTGGPITLSNDDITVKLGKDIVDPSNYEILPFTYKNNINKGKASVMIQGVGNFGSMKTITFTIGPKSFLWWWRKLWN